VNSDPNNPEAPRAPRRKGIAPRTARA